MRPLRLVMRAFGPYAEEETIDFRRMGDAALFLICGPTGAGKSTLIDAIAFALYGETCSEERDGRHSRSHFAAGRRTEVVFDFALGAERYRVQRSPEQERAKLRGEGVTTELHQATLWRRTPLNPADDLLEGEVMFARPEKVTEKVVALLGFDCRQFRQVIVLPQGRFRDLLTADVTTREAIFKKLFGTEIYTRIQNELKDRAQAIRKQHDELKTRRDEVLKGANTDTPENLAALETEGVDRLARQGEECAVLNRQAEEARVALESARGVAGKFQELRAAQTGHEAQSQRVTALEPGRATCELARRAELLEGVANAAAQRTHESAEATARRDRAQGEHERARSALATAREAFTAEQGRRAERDDLAATLAGLRRWREKVSALADLRTRVEVANLLAGGLQRQLGEARQLQQSLAQSLRQTSEERETCAAEATRGDSLTAQIQALETQSRQHRELLDCRRSVRAAQTRLESSSQARTGAENAHRAAAERLTHLQTAQRERRAALLAQTLVADQPCPVCGSSHHPQPARAEEAPPSDANIAAAQARVEDTAHGLDAATMTEAEDDRSLTMHRSQAESLAGVLGELAEVPPARWATQITEARARGQAAAAAAKRLPEMDARLRGMRERQAAAEASLPLLDTKERHAAGEAQRLAAELSTQEHEIPADLRTPTALETRIKREENTLQGWLDRLQSAQETLTQTERAAGAAETALGERAASCLQAEQAARLAGDELSVRLAEAGFADADRLRAARRSPAEIAQLEGTLRGAADGLAAARERLVRAEAAVTELAEPDLPTLEGRHREVADALQAATRTEGALDEHLRALTVARRNLVEIEAGLNTAVKDYELFGTLAAAAGGNNDKNLTLQRYVLGSLLDDVLVAATRRLLLMSRGRFQLERQQGVIDGRAAAGLALQVLDEHTGKSRPVGTLSGGESFLAALSLALGLADVVQAHTGGVRMEAMFIDEGFGSLDPESLDCAYQALLDLQRGGRLIGIISHVEELKARIDLRLEVQTGRQGSTINLVGAPLG